ncbi:MAG TPA: serine/threonine-protein kinase [Sandaracinaceae bacterium]
MRSTWPGGTGAPERPTDPDPAARPPRDDPTIQDPFSAELPIDVEDLERVTLLELPAIGRYGRYELLGRIAYGGMAEIFLAREAHVSAQRLLVIKRVLPHVAEDRHFVDMFVDEARLAMQLNHPNICHVYSFGEQDGTWYIAMEWVNGKPLSKIIKRARESGGIPVPIALKIIAQVAEALDYAHRACDAAGEPLGIVHRDVSPQNIMVSYDGVVKLLDFGIAKATSHSTRTEAGVIKGKFAYMSPQQCVGEPIDGRADIFALGVCMFEALTGKNPFRRKTEFDTMTRIVGDPTPSIRQRRPEVPEEVEKIVETALMKQPELRYQSAGEMQLAIEAVLPKLGPPVNAARLGEYVTKLFADEVREGPSLDMRVSIVPSGAGAVGADDSREDASPPRVRKPGATELDAEPFPREAAPPRKERGGALAVAVAVVVLIGLAGAGGALAWLLFGPHEGTGPAASPPIASGGVPIQPSEAAPPAPQPGSVFVDSVPQGATIVFGNRGAVGTTPLELGMVQPGTYDVRLTLEGFEDWSGQVQVAAGQRAALAAQLVARVREEGEERTAQRGPRPAPPGELSLNTQPWSRVYLGNRLLGTTPLGRVTVPSGTLRLRLVDRDGNEHRRTLRVPPGGHVAESFDLRRP